MACYNKQLWNLFIQAINFPLVNISILCNMQISFNNRQNIWLTFRVLINTETTAHILNLNILHYILFILMLFIPWLFLQQCDHNVVDRWRRGDRHRMCIRVSLWSAQVVFWMHLFHSSILILSLLPKGSLAFQALYDELDVRCWKEYINFTFCEFWLHVKINKDISSLTLKVVKLWIINNFRERLNHYIVKLSNNNGR